MSRAMVIVAAAVAAFGCRANRVGTVACEPGHRIFVACGCEDVGTCTPEPDPVIRVCDGGRPVEECNWETQLGEADDFPGCMRCPGLHVTCPESGMLLVAARGLYPDEIVHCDWAIRDDG